MVEGDRPSIAGGGIKMAMDMIVPAFPKAGVPRHPVERLTVKLKAKRRETPDTMSFVFEVMEGVLRHYPGQAVSLDLPVPQGTVTRTFTVASAPNLNNWFELTIKAAPDGYATRWMQEVLAVGDEITGRGAFGTFSIMYYPNTPLLLIGGGSGFTPMMSTLRWLSERGETTDVVVIQVARSKKDLLFREELDQIVTQMSTIKLFNVLSAPRKGEAWSGYRGRPDRAMIRAMVPDAYRRQTLCCGPIGFMDHMGKVLRAEGLDRARFLTESFGQKMAVPQDVVQPINGDGITVSIGAQTFDVAPDVPLSTSLAAAGKRIPTGCGEGQCGTCRVRLLEGEIEMDHQGGLSQQEEHQGYILACCTRPKTAIKIAI
ncbi:flavin reductase family protein [Celeribacter halophilus]|uniref:flavin reductase family protein n=1 Tax=Celeribacter halophilus TaxID=576117 RepID=UPI001C081DE6|nr:iron-sulfur cluster-binding domain-containing protein [Celeribacter halophilus]MDO6512123.1 iron-sulfur cluster-binding domain-containing protein [Celeribacter halophilus]